MKFKEREMKNELNDEMRYNPNTFGTHESIQSGVSNPEKQCCAALSIFSLMTLHHYYERAESEIENKTPRNILERMFVNSSKVTGDSLSEGEMGLLR